MSKSQVLLLKKWIADIKVPRFSSSGGIFYLIFIWFNFIDIQKNLL